MLFSLDLKQVINIFVIKYEQQTQMTWVRPRFYPYMRIFRYSYVWGLPTSNRLKAQYDPEAEGVVRLKTK